MKETRRAQQLTDLRRQLAWLVTLRWVAVGGMVIGALIAALTPSVGIAPLPICYLALGLAAINALLSLSLTRWRPDSDRHPRTFVRSQIAVDLGALCILTSVTGGVFSPLLPYYVFHMIIASILLSPRESYGAAGVASGLLAIVWTTTPASECHPHKPFHILLAMISTVWIAVYLTTSIMIRLRQREQETHALAEELGRRADELQRANIAIEETRQLETRYMRRVAHELRSPLGATISSLEIISKGIVGDLSPKQKELVTRAEVRARQLLKMVDDLLLLTRARSPRRIEVTKEPVSLKVEIARVAELLRARAESKDITLSINLSEDIPVINGDLEGLCQVFTNLIANAIKYTPNGGRVSVDGYVSNSTIVVEVSDTGIGIPEQDMPHVFDEFYRGSNARTFEEVGTGLGLAIAKGVSEAMGGSIRVASIVGEGTTFRLAIPIDSP